MLINFKSHIFLSVDFCCCHQFDSFCHFHSGSRTAAHRHPKTPMSRDLLQFLPNRVRVFTTHFDLNKIEVQLFHVGAPKRQFIFVIFLLLLSLIASSNHYYLYHRNFQLIVSSFNREKLRRNNNLVPPT